MPVKTKLLPLPEEIEPHCPNCGQRCRKIDIEGDEYKCGDCGMVFEAVIQILWGVTPPPE
jgi:predicted RNA-binding Zn-ribbon protein involved in translation (DUF1610 family)